MLPPRRTFATKIALTYTAVFLAIAIPSAYYVDRALEKSTFDSLKESLEQKAYVLAEGITPRAPKGKSIQGMIGQAQFSLTGESLQGLVESISRKTSSRITVIDAAGRVLSDSSKPFSEIASIENHASRPEMQAALKNQTGLSMRYSDTVRMRMLYVAVPVKIESTVIGAVRFSLPLDTVRQKLFYVRLPIALSFFSAIILVILLSFVFSRAMTRRIKKMTKAASRYTRDDLTEDIPIESEDELGVLAVAMNHMARSLKKKIMEVKKEKKKISVILDHMEEGVLGIDKDHRILIANPSIQKMFGIEQSSILQRGLLEVTRNARVDELAAKAIQTQENGETMMDLSAPEEKSLRVSAIGLRREDVQGLPSVSKSLDFDLPEEAGAICCILVFYDVTKLKKLETLRKDFVANVSHELRTPLTSIKGFVETLLNGALKDPEKSELFLKMLQEDTDRLTRLIDDLLELSRIESKASSLQLEPLDLREEARRAALVFEPRLKERKMQIELVFPPVLEKIRADRDKLKQVFLNLLDNAVKYNQEEGRVTVKIQSSGDTQTVSVEDTGIGIPEQSVPRVFERFYRVDKARARELGGTGLGLSIVKHIIESHGGYVACESRLGQGSIFSFTLPLNPFR